jgi:hypothetical protein
MRENTSAKYQPTSHLTSPTSWQSEVRKIAYWYKESQLKKEFKIKDGPHNYRQVMGMYVVCSFGPESDETIELFLAQ